MSAGKGDKPRPVNGDKYRSNYDKIFGSKKSKTVFENEDILIRMCENEKSGIVLNKHAIVKAKYI
jgi:hypothetical protein